MQVGLFLAYSKQTLIAYSSIFHNKKVPQEEASTASKVLRSLYFHYSSGNFPLLWRPFCNIGPLASE